MKNYMYAMLAFCCFLAFAQSSKAQEKILIQYAEAKDPKPLHPDLWQGLGNELMLSFADNNQRYAKNNPPVISQLSNEWKAVAWKGEKVHTRFLLWSAQERKNIHINTTALTDGKGHTIPASAITSGFVRYVLTDGLNKEGTGCGIPSRNEMDSSLAEDVIDFVPSTGMAANTTLPVWLSVRVPRDASPGVYTGKLEVVTDGRKQLLNCQVQVKDHVLPSPQEWQFHLDLWQNPYSIARVYKVKPWSKEHFNALKPYIQMLADAGQKAITVSMVYDPWRGQTQDIYGAMIQWTKKKDGSWHYDFSIFDQWVNFMMSYKIDKIINCYSMIPWNNRFYYHDEALGKDTVVEAKPGTEGYTAHWKPMLTAFAQHLKQKGWFGKTSIAMDERALEDMQQTIKLVKSVDPEFKLSLAGNYHTEIEKDIYDYCVPSAQQFDAEIMKKRLAAGYPTTYYTCCAEGYPNTFTFSPTAEATWLGWYAAAKNFSGYLRWAYNCWNEEPLVDSRFRSWSAGDTYLVYPGPRSSIRFERLVEGIQDYEKIRLLKADFSKNNSAQLAQLQQLLDGFDINALKETPAATMLVKAKEMMNQW